jgi:hypothetical protein
MKRILVLTLLLAGLSISLLGTQQAPEVLTGTISDSHCGASHQAPAGTKSERACLFACLKALAKWVLVDQNNRVFEIANQELPGLPLYAGRRVRLTGHLSGAVIVASRVEAYPPHLHIGHLMTNWRDTPGGVGLLIAAVSDAKIAALHATLAIKNPDSLDDLKLHAGHVLHALDPVVQPEGPASGYGVKKAADGAQQHLDFAWKAEGASAAVKDHAAHAGAALANAARWTRDAISVAEKIRSSTSAGDAAPLARNLNELAAKIVDAGLSQAHNQMMLMLKAEGLENAPR